MSERPLECAACQKTVNVRYQEMSLQRVTSMEMCSDCPVLKRKLQEDATAKAETVCCSCCHTSLESVEEGQPLGCLECYKVFAEAIGRNLIATGYLAPGVQYPLHVGRSPSLSMTTKLSALHDALHEALKKEKYEQAAFLRDQIKRITEQHE